MEGKKKSCILWDSWGNTTALLTRVHAFSKSQWGDRDTWCASSMVWTICRKGLLPSLGCVHRGCADNSVVGTALPSASYSVSHRFRCCEWSVPQEQRSKATVLTCCLLPRLTQVCMVLDNVAKQAIRFFWGYLVIETDLLPKVGWKIAAMT